MSIQLQIGIAPAVKRCQWCAEPATTFVIGTDACNACARGGRTYRVIRALGLWSRGGK